MSAGPIIELEIEEHHVRYRTFDLSGASLKLLGFAADIYGWSLRNPSGSVAAVMDLYDGDDASGTVVIPINIPNSGNAEQWFGPNGIRFNNAVFANVTAGEVKGSLFYRHIRR